MPIPLGVLAVAGAGGGGLATSYDLLETTVLGSSAASVTFSSLGSYSAYKHLQLRIVARSAKVETADDFLLRINSDTGSNYADHLMRARPSLGTVVSDARTSQTAIRMGSQNFIYAANANANLFTNVVLDILDFGNSSKNTTIKYLLGSQDGSTIINSVVVGSGLRTTASAVTTLQFYCAGGNVAANSRFSLYGIK